MSSFSIFNVIPPQANDRRTKLEDWCKELQEINKKFRYQIRNGDTDIKVFSKFYDEDEYAKFQEIPLSVLDPLGECPPWTLTNQYEEDAVPDDEPSMETPTEAENSNPWTKVVERNKSPKKRGRYPRKIYNYIERYLLGTDVRPG